MLSIVCAWTQDQRSRQGKTFDNYVELLDVTESTEEFELQHPFPRL